mmetsp:Transcript_38787/g.120756  ORF Transcript_38787/g.120756 Transcript_38787/m.120756 type:complete len:352 (+) Transcript_38787:556-1611(+)
MRDHVVGDLRPQCTADSDWEPIQHCRRAGIADLALGNARHLHSNDATESGEVPQDRDVHRRPHADAVEEDAGHRCRLLRSGMHPDQVLDLCIWDLDIYPPWAESDGAQAPAEDLARAVEKGVQQQRPAPGAAHASDVPRGLPITFGCVLDLRRCVLPARATRNRQQNQLRERRGPDSDGAAVGEHPVKDPEPAFRIVVPTARSKVVADVHVETVASRDRLPHVPEGRHLRPGLLLHPARARLRLLRPARRSRHEGVGGDPHQRPHARACHGSAEERLPQGALHAAVPHQAQALHSSPEHGKRSGAGRTAHAAGPHHTRQPRGGQPDESELQDRVDHVQPHRGMAQRSSLSE